MRNIFLQSLFLLLISLHAYAADVPHAHEHTHSESNAHVHGSAELTIAIVENTLEIHLESPAVNIVGFEHKVTSPDQVQAVEKAKLLLESSPKLFSFSGTTCNAVKATVNMPAHMTHNETHADHHEHVAQEKEIHHHDEISHSEITAFYHYDCEQGSDISQVSIDFFPQFPGIETLNVMWLTDQKQGATKLTEKSHVVRIR